MHRIGLIQDIGAASAMGGAGTPWTSATQISRSVQCIVVKQNLQIAATKERYDEVVGKKSIIHMNCDYGEQAVKIENCEVSCLG